MLGLCPNCAKYVALIEEHAAKGEESWLRCPRCDAPTTDTEVMNNFASVAAKVDRWVAQGEPDSYDNARFIVVHYRELEQPFTIFARSDGMAIGAVQGNV